MRRILHICLCCIVAFSVTATDTRTRIFNPSFHSLQIKNAVNDQLPPVIVSGSNDALVLSFDEFAETYRNLRYSLHHLDADWNIDGLVSDEYLDTFNDTPIDNFDYSNTTTAHYVHYALTIPDGRVVLLVSGNYLIKVYEDGNPDETLLQARFYVSEETVDVSGSVTGITDIDYRDAHQQLSIMIDGKDNLTLDDLSNRLIVKIMQNGRQDNIISVSHPQFITGNTARYEHQRQLIFPAGNEYRRFETISTTFPGRGVENIVYAYPYYHMKLLRDQKRNITGYAYDRTQRGRYRVRQQNSNDSDYDADYVVVHFELEAPPYPNAEIYIDGDFTNRLFDAESRMNYDASDGVYRHTMMLKQGSYNYQYLVKPVGASEGLTLPVEGDFYQTDNEYTILVYYRRPGARYDRLIAVKTLYGMNGN